MFDVVTIGAFTRDVFLTSGDFRIIKSDSFKTGYGECFAYGSKIDLTDIIIETGGGATNAAYTFKNLGIQTSIHARIGDDSTGKELFSELKKKRIDTSNVSVIKGGKSAYSTILSMEGWDRTILTFRGVSKEFNEKDVNWKQMKAKWFYISSVAGNLDFLKKTFAFAKKNKIKISWNPGGAELQYGYKTLKPFIDSSSIFNINTEEAKKLFKGSFTSPKRSLKKIKKSSVECITITDGKKGAYAYNGEEMLYASSLPVDVINTTGAGDAFCSGLTAGIILKNDLEYGLRLGTLNAAGCIQQVGAKKGLLSKLPSQKQINEVIITSL